MSKAKNAPSFHLESLHGVCKLHVFLDVFQGKLVSIFDVIHAHAARSFIHLATDHTNKKPILDCITPNQLINPSN